MLAVVVFGSVAVWAETNSIPWRLPSYTLNARAMSVRNVFDTFGVAEGVPVMMSDSVAGVVSGVFRNMPAVEFLDRVATVNNLIWYYDGAQIYVYSAGESVTRLIDLKYMKGGEVQTMLKELNVEDARYPIKTAQNDELIMVSGPPRYVELVCEMIARADTLREQRTFNEVEVRLFPLKYTWADNVSFSVSTPESAVPLKGIAQLLQEMTKSEGGAREQDGTNAMSRSEIEANRMGLNTKAVILPENRLNAVMVRDVATKMPMYERLIRQLDKPTKLLEIGITTLELTKEDALDWQMSLSGSGNKTEGDDGNEHTFGAGQVIDNILLPAALSGTGLSGAYTLVANNYKLGASITALKTKGKTRSISRTSLLTMNNLGASITDTQSYNAKVVGEKVASLQSVSAGTTFKVKPRAVKSSDANVNHRVWMTLEIQDGGFESAKVDGMPMTRSTTLTTQTVLNEGQSIILAGYMRELEGESGWGIPYLRDIPYLGWLFGGKSHSNQYVQRFFIMTPRVIELTGPDTPLDQARWQHDVREVERIQSSAEEIDSERKLRKIEGEEARQILEEKSAQKLDRREAEIDRDRRQRGLETRQAEDQLERDIRYWLDEFERQDREYLEQRRRDR